MPAKPKAEPNKNEPQKETSLPEEDKILQNSTVTEYLRRLNSEERYNKDHQTYTRILLPKKDGIWKVLRKIL